jgi:DNA-binding transcriptional LysR family regulator
VSTQRLSGLKLNALVALDALLTECSVTRAARRARLTQSAMSQTLARLRELFGDPLLVRRGRAYVRTPRAEAMVGPLAEAIAAVERAVQIGMSFDPTRAKRTFRVAMTDLHAAIVLPPLLRAIAREAPDVRLQAEAMAMSGVSDRIVAGEIDLAIGFALGARERLHSEALFEDDFVLLVRRGHALTRRRRVRLEDYAKHDHLANTPVGFVPRAMSGAASPLGEETRIRSSLPYLLPLAALVRATDLVATVPRRLLGARVSLDGIAVIEAPPEMPKVTHAMWWHARSDRDAAHAWLRDGVRSAFARGPEEAQRRAGAVKGS